MLIHAGYWDSQNGGQSCNWGRFYWLRTHTYPKDILPTQLSRDFTVDSRKMIIWAACICSKNGHPRPRICTVSFRSKQLRTILLLCTGTVMHLIRVKCTLPDHVIVNHLYMGHAPPPHCSSKDKILCSRTPRGIYDHLFIVKTELHSFFYANTVGTHHPEPNTTASSCLAAN